MTVIGLGERAGNAPLEEVAVAATQLYGYDTGVRLPDLQAIAELVSAAARRPIPVDKSIVGDHAFTHEFGIHVDGLLKDKLTYQSLDPSALGRAHRIVIGKHWVRRPSRRCWAICAFPWIWKAGGSCARARPCASSQGTGQPGSVEGYLARRPRAVGSERAMKRATPDVIQAAARDASVGAASSIRHLAGGCSSKIWDASRVAIPLRAASLRVCSPIRAFTRSSGTDWRIGCGCMNGALPHG